MKKTLVATIWMIGLFPVLSAIALLGMTIPRLHLFQDILSVICIAVAMYKFVQLIKSYDSYYEQVHDNVCTGKLQFNVGPLCCCCFCLPSAEINRSNAFKVKCIILQYPLISTLTSALTMVTWLDGNYEAGQWAVDSPYPYLTIIRVISVLVAIYGLNIFVKLCMDAMRSLMIKPKFIALRLAMLFYAIQGILFDILVQFTHLFEYSSCFSGAVMGNYYQNMVFCIEMFLLTLMNFWSYRRALRPRGGSSNNGGVTNEDAVDINDQDTVKDIEKNQQIELEEVSNAQKDVSVAAHDANGISEMESTKNTIAKEQTSAREKDSKEVTSAGDSSYINHVYAEESEDNDKP